MTDTRILFPQQPLIIPGQSKSVLTNSPDKGTTKDGFTFKQILQNESSVKFSQHALQRLQSRNISLNANELQKLDMAVEKAAQKGSKESLILFDNQLAFVVSVKNKTVITAMDSTSIKDNVFTNIDSAVII